MSRYDDISPMDLDPDTGRPYAGYSSPSLDTSFHDHEMSGESSSEDWSLFKIGDPVVWPNGVEGTVRGIDSSDNTLLDDCGGWVSASETERLA